MLGIFMDQRTQGDTKGQARRFGLDGLRTVSFLLGVDRHQKLMGDNWEEFSDDGPLS
jgi:hypothetical protein